MLKKSVARGVALPRHPREQVMRQRHARDLARESSRERRTTYPSREMHAVAQAARGEDLVDVGRSVNHTTPQA
jgi:hypothetical protein